MGRASRDKGSRAERALVAELERHGWSDAFRVPLSGAAQGFKGDVHARPPGWGTKLVFENKARAKGFEKFYRLAQAYGGTTRVTTGDLECVISLDPENIVPGVVKEYRWFHSFPKEQHKDILSLFALKAKWLGDADVLTLKQDRNPFLYIRYSK